MSFPVASLWERGGGWTASGNTLQGVTPNLKLIFVAEFRNEHQINDVGRWALRRRRLKRSSLPEAMTKNVVRFFSRKNRVTPSVAVPGDTNSSDVTGRFSFL